MKLVNLVTMYVYVTDMLRIINISGFSLFQRRRQENSSGGPSFSLGGPTLPHPLPFLPSHLPPFPSPSLPFSSLPLPYLSLPFPSPLVPSPPLRSRPPKIQLGGLGERCKLPQRDLGRNPSRQTIWCILALKSDIWWQQF